MNVTFNVPESELANLGNQLFLLTQEWLAPVQMAMAETFYGVVQNNFGEAGEDRPIEWEMLSPAYSRKVGRPHATLEVTGRLRESIHFDAGPERGFVSVTNALVPYATVHQYGGGNNIPARPYFPIDASGEITAYTRAKVEAAAIEALEKLT